MSLTVGELNVYITADRSGFRRGVKDAKDDLKGLQRDADGRLSDIKSRFGEAGEESGEGLGDGIERRARPHLKNLDDSLQKVGERVVSVSKLAGKAGGIAVLGTALAGAAVQSLSLVAAILPAAGAIGLLPTIAVSAAGALGTLKLATSGLGAAFKAVGAGDAKKFDEALKKLSPSAQALAREVRALHPALDGLRRDVQESVFRGLSGEVRALAATWLPILHDRLTGIGLAWNAAFRNAAQAARSGMVVRGITAALDGAHLSLAQLNDAVGPLVRGFGALVGAAVPFVSNFGRGLATLATRFGTFLQAAASSGQLNSFFVLVTNTLEDLGGIVMQVGGILRSVLGAAAAGTGGLLNNLRMALGAVNRFLSSTEGQTALRDFFASTSGVLRALLPSLMILASAFGTVLAPAIGQVAAVLAPVVRVLATQLAGAVTILAPSLPQLATAFSNILLAVAPLLPLVATVAATLAGPLASAITLLAPLAPTILAVAAAIRVAAIAQGVLNAVMALNPWVLVAAAVIGLAILIVKNWDTIKAATLGAWHAITGTITGAARGVLGWLRANWPLILAVLAGPIGLAVVLIARNWARIRSGAVSAWNGVVSFLRGIPGRILGALGSLGALLVQAGRNVISGLIAGILSQLGPLGSALGTVGRFIAAHKGPRSKDLAMLHPAGLAIMTGLRAGIAAGLPDLGRQLAGVSAVIGAEGGGVAGTVAYAGGAGRAPGGAGDAAGGGVVRLEIRSGGSRLDDLLVEVINKAIRVGKVKVKTP